MEIKKSCKTIYTYKNKNSIYRKNSTRVCIIFLAVTLHINNIYKTISNIIFEY